VSFFLGDRRSLVLRMASCQAVFTLYEKHDIVQSCSARHVMPPVAASF